MNVTITSSRINQLPLDDGRINIEAIQGLAVAEIRSTSYENSGQDGAFMDSQFYGARMISINGTIENLGCDGNITGRRDLILATPIKEDVELRFRTTDGKLLSALGNVVGFDMPYNDDTRSEYKIDVFCGDGLLYDLTDGDEQCISLDKYIASGLNWPLDWSPLQWGDGSNGAVTATNSGQASTYPTITISDGATNPKITNITTGELFELNVTTTTGDEIIINMRNRIVTLNGSSIYSLVDEQSTWWNLITGGNDIVFETSDADDDASATLCWLPAYLGV